MITIPKLREEAEKASEKGDHYYGSLLNSAADEMEELAEQLAGTIRVASEALRRLKERGLQ